MEPALNALPGELPVVEGKAQAPFRTLDLPVQQREPVQIRQDQQASQQPDRPQNRPILFEPRREDAGIHDHAKDREEQTEDRVEGLLVARWIARALTLPEPRSRPRAVGLVRAIEVHSGADSSMIVSVRSRSREPVASGHSVGLRLREDTQTRRSARTLPLWADATLSRIAELRTQELVMLLDARDAVPAPARRSGPNPGPRSGRLRPPRPWTA